MVLVKNLMDEGNEVILDIKPLEFYQIYDQNENHSLDLKSYNCLKVTTMDYIYNMACNMGGMVLLRIIRPMYAFCFNY